MEVDQKRFTWEVEPHPAELYAASTQAVPLPGLKAVDDEALRQYEREGYMAIENAFSMEEVEAARAGILDLVARRKPGFDNIEFEAHAQQRLEQISPEQRQDYVRKLMGFVHYDERLKQISEHPSLMPILQRILKARPVLFQDMALLKPPHGREKPWHQDNAYFDIPLGTPIVGVWIALDEVSVENGCMHLLAGGHREGAMPHFKIRDWQLCDRDMMNRVCVAVPLRPGGCLIFNGMLPHGTPRNNTDQRRRALQYHYCPEGVQKVAAEVRMAAFGGEGRNVSC